MDYNSFLNTVATLLVVPNTDPTFLSILPQAIQYAENRMYRELDLIQTTTTATADTTPYVRTVSIPNNLIVVNSAYLVTPSGANPNDFGSKRNPMIRVSIDFLNATYPYGGAAVIGQNPRYYATINESTIQIAPASASSYVIEFYGIIRPTPLSASNTTTILTSYLPDIFVAAAMVFLSAYQRDFGAQSDDPRLAQSWETQYQTLKQSAVAEIARAKAQGQSWQPYSTPTQATATVRGIAQ